MLQIVLALPVLGPLQLSLAGADYREVSPPPLPLASPPLPPPSVYLPPGVLVIGREGLRERRSSNDAVGKGEIRGKFYERTRKNKGKKMPPSAQPLARVR